MVQTTRYLWDSYNSTNPLGPLLLSLGHHHLHLFILPIIYIIITVGYEKFVWILADDEVTIILCNSKADCKAYDHASICKWVPHNNGKLVTLCNLCLNVSFHVKTLNDYDYDCKLTMRNYWIPIFNGKQLVWYILMQVKFNVHMLTNDQSGGEGGGSCGMAKESHEPSFFSF